jgi:adenosylmethionine-8-amino-7-oxononanoate aminotransferase
MTSHMIHRQAASTLPEIVSGRGIELIDSTGKTYLDACGGAAVSCLGHGHPAITASLAAQSHKIAYAHTSFFTNRPAEALAERLAAAAPGDLDHVYFAGSGSEAVEAALKMARQYHVEYGQASRTHVISRRLSYHGNTLGALSVSGNPFRRGPYEPLLFPATFIDACYAYRNALPGETPEAYGLRAASALETAILRHEPRTVMAFIAETVVGATGGAIPPAPGYFPEIRRICDRHGVLLILDEVMCGAGRTGTFLSCEQDGINPDIVTLAKGLGAGYQPIGATLCTRRIYDAITGGNGAFRHGQTYSAHALCCAAALAVQHVVDNENLLARVVTAGHYLHGRLAERFGNHAACGDIRGRGLLQAIEFVADRTTKRPFPAQLGLAARIKAEAFSRGLLVYPGPAATDATTGDHVLLAPPYIATDAELDSIVDLLGAAVDAALASVRAQAA